MRKLLVIFILTMAAAVGFTPHSFAQSPSNDASAIRFDVASVKLNKTAGDRVVLNYPPDGFLAVNATPRMLVRLAYSPIDDYRIVGGADWIDSERFDIEAKLDNSELELLQKLSPSQLLGERRRMLQALLADRFGLQTHHETRELSGFALVIGKNGPKFHDATPGDKYPNGFKASDGQPGVGLYAAAPTRLIGQGATMQILAYMLSQRLGRVVVDRTNLNGRYDFELLWTTDQGPSMPDENQSSDISTPNGSAPFVFDAIQQQLGLKLESQKIPTELLVIDHIERPTKN